MQYSRLGLVVATAAMLTSSTAFAQSLEDSAACEDKIVAYGQASGFEEQWRLNLPETRGGGALLYFGAVHSRDPNHTQVAEIVDAWERFGPTVAFYEGPDRGHAGDIDQTVTAGGESALVRYLAVRDDVDLARLEPEAVAEAEFVLTRFPAEQVKLFYVLREASRLREAEGLEPGEIERRIATLLERTKALGELGRTITTVEELSDAYARYWDSPPNWWQAPARWFDPLLASESTGGIFTNEINVLSSHYRDVHMFRVLREAALRGERVFAVVGRNHVAMQGPALECDLKQE